MGIRKLIKSYKELGIREFVSKWKDGIGNISVEDQLKSQVLFTKLTLLGIFCGLIVSLFSLSNLWWLAIILVAAFGNTLISLISLVQKIKFMNQMKGGSLNNV